MVEFNLKPIRLNLFNSSKILLFREADYEIGLHLSLDTELFLIFLGGPFMSKNYWDRPGNHKTPVFLLWKLVNRL